MMNTHLCTLEILFKIIRQNLREKMFRFHQDFPSFSFNKHELIKLKQKEFIK